MIYSYLRKTLGLNQGWHFALVSMPLVSSHLESAQFSSVLSHVWLFVTPSTACQASLSVTNSWSLIKLMSIELVMSSNHLICHPLLLLPSIFPSIKVFSKESVLCIRWPKYSSFTLKGRALGLIIPVNVDIHSCHLLFDHFQFALIHGPDIPGSYAILLFTTSDLASITSHIQSWVLFLLWLHPFILSGVISPLISCSILGTYWPGEFLFQ